MRSRDDDILFKVYTYKVKDAAGQDFNHWLNDLFLNYPEWKAIVSGLLYMSNSV
jgi:hypothetical protein